MTKKEKQYLQQQIEHNKEIIKKVENGELWVDIFKTKEMRVSFVQGLTYANDVLDKFING